METPGPFRTDLAVRLHGRSLGRAPALFFLHGLTDSGSGWPGAVAHWQDRYAIVAIDHRGHGESPRFTREQLQAHPGEVMVSDAVALLEQMPQPPVVIGHSLGGAVALTAAVRRPELVRALVLEDPAPRGPAEPQRDEARGADHVAGLQASLAAPDEESLVAARRRAHPDWPESELLVTGKAEQQTDLVYLAHGDLKPVTAWPDLFAGLRVPTLVLSGDAQTRLAELCIDDQVEKGIAAVGNGHVRFTRIPGAGHCIRRERPQEFYAVVDGWLAQLVLDA